MDASTQLAVSTALADAMGVDPATVVVVVMDFLVTAAMGLGGVSLDAWNANKRASMSAFTGGLAADLGVDVSLISVEEPIVVDSTSLSVPFSICGFGLGSDAAAAAAAGIVTAASNPDSDLLYALYEVGLPVSGTGVSDGPYVSATLAVSIAITDPDSRSASSSIGSNLMAAVYGGGLKSALADSGVYAEPVVTAVPQTTFASPPPPSLLF